MNARNLAWLTGAVALGVALTAAAAPQASREVDQKTVCLACHVEQEAHEPDGRAPPAGGGRPVHGMSQPARGAVRKAAAGSTRADVR